MASLSTSPCNLCPRLCSARRSEGERGYCGASDEVVASRASLHMWEEPVISGKRGSGTVFFSNCSLGCVYCQNAEIAHHETGMTISTTELARVFGNLQEMGALNVNCVTPTHYSLDIVEAVSIARRRGLSIPIVWNTSGYERAETVDFVGESVDVYLADFKYFDNELARAYSNAADYRDVAIAALEHMVDSAGMPTFDEVDGMPRMTGGVIVRHMVLPGALDNSKNALKFLYDRFGNDVLYSVMNQYTPIMDGRTRRDYPQLHERVTADEYEEVLDFADAIGIDDYFWQDAPASAESFIPAWDGSGLRL